MQTQELVNGSYSDRRYQTWQGSSHSTPERDRAKDVDARTETAQQRTGGWQGAQQEWGAGTVEADVAVALRLGVAGVGLPVGVVLGAVVVGQLQARRLLEHPFHLPRRRVSTHNVQMSVAFSETTQLICQCTGRYRDSNIYTIYLLLDPTTSQQMQ